MILFFLFCYIVMLGRCWNDTTSWSFNKAVKFQPTVWSTVCTTGILQPCLLFLVWEINVFAKFVYSLVIPCHCQVNQYSENCYTVVTIGAYSSEMTWRWNFCVCISTFKSERCHVCLHLLIWHWMSQSSV